MRPDLDLVGQLGRILAGHGGVRLALLFGSRARGSANSASDIDLAVDAPEVDLRALSGELAVALGTEVDVISLDAVTIPLLEALINDSIVVHEARPGAGAAWRSSALAQLEIDRPWYRRMRDAWLARVAERGVGDGQ